MNAIVYLLVIAITAAWIRHSLCSVPTHLPPPRKQTMSGMPIRREGSRRDQHQQAINAAAQTTATP